MSQLALAVHRRRTEEHDRKVQRIARQLAARKTTRPLSLRKKAVSHVVPKANDSRATDEKIDVSDLDRILSIDADARVCVAEPGVTFEDLVNATLEYGLVPLIVPELKTITVGGAVAGCSIESASFLHGGFHDTCLEYEVITPRGEVLRCEAYGENELIFQMMHGTFGTLGIISKLVMRLGPAKPYVKVINEKYGTLDEYLRAIRRHYEAQDADFMDGVIHSPDLHVLCVGRFVDFAPYAHRYDWTRVYSDSTRRRDVDIMRTPDYYFRWDAGISRFTRGSYLNRLLLGKLADSSTILRLANTFRFLLPKNRPPITLDVFLPCSRVGEFLSWYRRELGFFPLWCVPYKRVRDYEWISPAFFERNPDDDLYVDLAIYGMKQPPDGRNYYRLIEEKLLELGAMKTLISYNFFAEDEFWSIWNRENYERAKAITDPTGVLRDLYSKTCR